jgi:PST family polysaccharide transporter
MLLGGATILITAGAAPFGVTTVSAALFAGIGLVCAVYIHQLAGALKAPRRELIAAFGPAMAGTAVMAGALILARRLTADAQPIAELVILMAVGAAVYGAVILGVARRRLLADARTFGRAQSEMA